MICVLICHTGRYQQRRRRRPRAPYGTDDHLVHLRDGCRLRQRPTRGSQHAPLLLRLGIDPGVQVREQATADNGRQRRNAGRRDKQHGQRFGHHIAERPGRLTREQPAKPCQWRGADHRQQAARQQTPIRCPEDDADIEHASGKDGVGCRERD